MGYSELEISGATLVMLMERNLSECGKHLKLLLPEDLDTFKEHVCKRVEKAEGLKSTLMSNEEAIPDSEKLESLKKATENEILAGYDLIVKINKRFEQIEKDKAKEEKQAHASKMKQAQKLGLLKGQRNNGY